HPKSSHPLIESDWRILENRSYFQSELLFAVIAKPNTPRLDERVLCTTTARASDLSVRPAQLNSVFKGALRIGKVNNRLLQCLCLFHDSRVRFLRLRFKYIITDDPGRGEGVA